MLSATACPGVSQGQRRPRSHERSKGAKMPSGSSRDARDAAQKARQLSHDHDRNHRDADPSDKAIASRGTELRRLADEATAKHGDVQRTERAADAAVRRDERAA